MHAVGVEAKAGERIVAVNGQRVSRERPPQALLVHQAGARIELTLSADDSMMGQPLPEKGSLSIHLDGDGNASTKEAGDLTAAVQVFSGTPITVILESAAQ